jgi:hypothetical protein
MYVLLYCLVLLALSVALVSMTYVWICGLRHALRTRQDPDFGTGRKALWLFVMIAFGWLGAALYWTIAYPRSA